MKNKQNHLRIHAVEKLFEAFLLLETKDEVKRFLNDLCTPQEILTLADRLHVSKQLSKGNLSYRKIHETTGASLATITRVARFLKNEPHQGYKLILQKIKKQQTVKSST